MKIIKNPLAEYLLNSEAGIVFIKNSREEEYLSYYALFQKAKALLFHLQKKELQPGDELIISVEDNKSFVLLFWACLLGKIIPIPLAAGNQTEQRLKVVNALKILKRPAIAIERNYLKQLKTVLDNDDHYMLDEISDRILIVDEIEDQIGEGDIKDVDRDDLAYVQFSSGSTGKPKGVRLTYTNLLSNVKDIISRSQTSRKDSLLAWLPLAHDMGLICFHLSGVVAGATQYIMPTSLFIRRPGMWLEKASEHKATQLYSPNFGYHYLLSQYPLTHNFDHWDLSWVRLIYNGAEPISEELCHEFVSRLESAQLNPNCIFPGYGLAEASVAVTLPEVNKTIESCTVIRSSLNVGQSIQQCTPQNEQALSLVCVGKTIEHCELRICDDTDNVLHEKTIGNIQIKGKNVTRGYYNNESETSKLYTSDGWLRTGDLGFLKDEKLYVSGRKKNIIIVNGINYYPYDIEAAIIRENSHVSLGKVVVCNDQNQSSEGVIVFVFYKGSTKDFSSLSREIKRIVLDEIGIRVLHVIPVKKIPKTTSGKIQNFYLVNAYLNGQYANVLSELGRLEAKKESGGDGTVEEVLISIIQDLLPTVELDNSLSFFDSSLSSLKAVLLVNRINRKFNVSINVGDIIKYPGISALSEFISTSPRELVVKIEPAPISDLYPASLVQQKFWLISQKSEDSIYPTALYEAFLLNDFLDITKFKEAVSQVIDENEILRTSFITRGNGLFQKINPNNKLLLEFIDLTHNPNASLRVNTLFNDVLQAFGNEMLFQIVIYKLEADKYAILFVFDHIIIDGWSINLFAESLKKYYQLEITDVPEPAIKRLQYRDFSVWQRNTLDSGAMVVNKDFWLKELEEVGLPKELPFSRKTPVSSSEVTAITYDFSTNQVQGLLSLADSTESTLYMILLSVVGLILNKYLFSDEVVIGTTDNGRSEICIEDIIGCFINTLPVKVSVRESDSFNTLLARTKETLLEIHKHKRYPFEQLLKDIAKNRDNVQEALFNVQVLFQNFDDEISIRNVFGHDKTVPIELNYVSSLTDIEFEFIQLQNSIQLKFKYNKEKFCLEDIQNFLQHYFHILDSVIEFSDQNINSIDFLLKHDRALLQNFNQTSVPYDCLGLIQRFENIVRQYGSHTALINKDHHITYEALLLRVLKIAKGISNLGLANPKVVILLPASEDLIISILGVLKASGTYIPIDTSNPSERIHNLIKQVNPDLILSEPNWKEEIPSEYLYDSVEQLLATPNSEDGNIDIPYQENASAYILFTSGSTGVPKGVVVSYESLNDYINTFIDRFSVIDRECVLQISPVSFDILIEEIFPALLCGGKVCISSSGAKDIQTVQSKIVQEKISIISSTPVVINHLNNAGIDFPSLRLIISGGEQLFPHNIDRLIETADVYNTYGPTEATVCATYNHVIATKNAGLIGRPIANHEIHILDKSLNPLPVGAIGEICIAGTGVAIGYLNDDALTENSFLFRHDVMGGRMYRTGDLGCWTDDGNVKFLGRKDAQLKIRGYRIEPGEIVNLLCQYAEIQDAFINIYKHKEEPILIAYVVFFKKIESEKLLSDLMKKLPFYMVPSAVVEIESLPMTNNGKVDVSRLPTPDLGIDKNSRETIVTDDTEYQLLQIWRNIFDNPDLTVLDNFFVIGGNSIYAVQITNRIETALKTRVSIDQIFWNPTVRALRNSIGSVKTDPLPSFHAIEEQEYYSVSPEQRRIWYLNQFNKHSAAYNLAWQFTIVKDKVGDFKDAVRYLTKKYEVLRTSIKLIDGQVKQIIHTDTIEPNIYILTDIRSNIDWIKREACMPFGFEERYLYRIVLFDKGDDSISCVLVFHHIIADGWSVNKFIAELLQQIEIANNESDLPYQYKDFASWANIIQEKYSQPQKEYWLKQLQGTLPTLQLPSPNQRAKKQLSADGSTKYFPIQDNFLEAVQKMARDSSVTDFVVYLSLFNLLFQKYTQQNEFIIATPSSGRTLQIFEEQLGYFLNVLPLRTVVNISNNFFSLIEDVNQVVLDAFRNEYLPLEELLEELDISRESGKVSLFDVMFVFQNFNQPSYGDYDHKSDSIVNDIQEIDVEESFNDLLFEINRFNGEWQLKVRFNTGLFSSYFIDQLVNRFFFLAWQALEDPANSLTEFRLINDHERSLVINQFNVPYQLFDEFDVVKSFHETALRYPGRIAITCKDRAFSYNELESRINAFVQVLDTHSFSGEGAIACILVTRSEWTVISMLAVLEHRATFLLLDSEHPVKHIEDLIIDSNPQILITDLMELVDKMSCDLPAIIDLATINDGFVNKEDTDGVESALFNLTWPAYIMYTSGSSGKSKGVVVPYEALNNYVKTFIDYFKVNKDAVVLQQSSFSFDILIEEIFPVLCSGGKLVLASEHGRDVEALAQQIETKKISIVSITPLIAYELNNHFIKLRTLKTLISGGDVLRQNRIGDLLSICNVYNTYGPTESTVCATYHKISSPTAETNIIGRPINNYRIYIVDENNDLVPPMVRGQICVEGPGVALGYLNQPEEMVEKFFDIPNSKASRQYRTGDEAMWLKDGTIYFFGRTDAQVKINGYRIELQEIAHTLGENSSVKHCVVLYEPISDTTKTLVAFVVLEENISVEDLRRQFYNRMPYYFVPTHFIQLNKLPINVSGKVDNNALGNLFMSRKKEDSSSRQGAASIIDQTILKIVSQILGVSSVGRNDNFFSLGLNSIKAIQIASRISQEMNCEINFTDLFRNPSVASLVPRFAQAQSYVSTSHVYEDQEYYSLTHAQKSLWFIHQLNGSLAYNIVFVFQVKGDVTFSMLENSLKLLLEKHASLRSSFFTIDDVPKQKIASVNAINVEIIHHVSDGRIALKEQIIYDEQNKPFDLEKGPLLRANLFSDDQLGKIFNLTIHHSVCDGWSIGNIYKEISDCLNAHEITANKSKISPQYKDYIISQSNNLQFSVSEHEPYWRQYLSGFQPLSLPIDFPRPAIQSQQGASVHIELFNNLLLDSLKHIQEKENVSLNMIFLSAVNILLYKYTSQSDITLGVPVSVRKSAEWEEEIGYFINTVVLRNVFSKEDTIGELINLVNKNFLSVMEHKEYPFDMLVDKLSVERDLKASPVFNVMVVMHNNYQHSQVQPTKQNIELIPIVTDKSTTKFDLTFNFYEKNDGYHVELEYNIDLFKKETVERLLSDLVSLLKKVPDNLKKSINVVNLLTDDEIDDLLTRYVASDVYNGNVIDWIEETAIRNPDSIAVICDEKYFSYKYLMDAVGQLSCILTEKHGVREGDKVAVMLERSERPVITFLAIMKIGATYIPLDPHYPANRISYIIRDASVAVAITQEKFKRYFGANVKKVLYDLKDCNNHEKNNIKTQISLNEIAYVIYTSGSTGDPKGVAISHNNLISFLSWCKDEFCEDTWQVLYAGTSYCFDLSIFEMFYTLTTGKTLRVLSDGLDIPNWLAYDNNIALNTVPSVVETLVFENTDFINVRAINMAGEPVPVYLKRYLQSKDNLIIRNLYGPTEDTTYSTCYRFNDGHDIIPIGKPIHNTQLFILNSDLNLVPDGTKGDIYLAGDGVAAGYLNRSEMTLESFIQHPYYNNIKLYKTGDVGRWLPDGNVEFLGRIDNQVKLRGYRIELGEVESVLSKFESLINVVVSIVETDRTEVLAAYYTVIEEFKEDELRRYAQDNLPDYMVPSSFIKLEKFPLLPNGKIDKKSLPKPQIKENKESDNHWNAEDQHELRLIGIWNEILEKSIDSPDDNFFHIGGHSLKAYQIISRTNKIFRTQLSLKDIFIHPTLRSFSTLVKSSLKSFAISPSFVEEQVHYPVSSSQRRIWILEKISDTAGIYNMYGAYHIKGDLNIDVLKSVYNILLTRHESLRTSFIEVNDEVRLRVNHNVKFDFSFIIELNETSPKLSEILSDEAFYHFDFISVSLFRVGLIQMGKDQYIVSVNMHHLISDGWSRDILMQEVFELYSKMVFNDKLLDPLPIQFKDYSCFENQMLSDEILAEQRTYWKSQFEVERKSFTLEAGNKRPSIKTYSGASFQQSLGLDLTNSIFQSCEEEEVTLFMYMLSAVVALFYKYTGQCDFTIGTPITGRKFEVLEKQIGFYSNTLALQNKVNGEMTFKNLLEKVKVSTLEAFNNADYPFDQLIEDLQIQRDTSRSPLFDIMLVIDEEIVDFSKVSGLYVEPIEPLVSRSKFDIVINVNRKNGELVTDFTYNIDIFRSSFIERFSMHLRELLWSTVNTDTIISKIEYFSENEKNALVSARKPIQTIISDENVVDMFYDTVKRFPLTPAVKFNNETISYKDFDMRSNQLANYLQNNYSLRDGDIVGIVMGRSIDLIISIWAILKTGAVYAPIDPHSPEKRKQQILDNCNPRVVLIDTANKFLQSYFSVLSVTEIDFNRLPQERPSHTIKGSTGIYVIHTSGTTGIPKGVLVEHSAIVNLVRWVNSITFDHHSERMVALLNAPLSFDSSVKLLFSTLISGNTLVMVPDHIRQLPNDLVKYMLHHEVDIFDVTPSFLNFLLDVPQFNKLKLKYCLVGGEMVSKSLVNRFYNVFDHKASFINMYGVTEASVDSTYCIAKENHISIGISIDNTEVFILDDDGNPLPNDVSGEVAIAGVGLAKGYLNDPILTNEKFIHSNIFGEVRLYLTGDLGYIRDGEIYMLGRKDDQVKIRGYRIELNEIKHVLLQMVGMKDVYVNTQPDNQKENHIVAYCCTEWPITYAEAREFLQQQLPDYMMPFWIVFLEEFPVTRNGKLDKQALPILNRITEEINIDTEDDITNTVFNTYVKILERTDIKPLDNFFQNGGNSLKVLQLFKLLNNAYPNTLQVYELFSNPNINMLSQLIKSRVNIFPETGDQNAENDPLNFIEL